MIKKQTLTLSLAAALFGFTALGATNPPTAAAGTSMDAAIERYLMDHPEVIMKSLTNFQVKQKQAAQERARQAETAEREFLVNDPSSRPPAIPRVSRWWSFSTIVVDTARKSVRPWPSSWRRTRT